MKSVKEARAELDVISNRIAVALAKREGVLKSFSTTRSLARKTDQEQDVEESSLFRPEPPNLGLGAPIPSQFLVSEAERNNKTLRERFFPKKATRDSKPQNEDRNVKTNKKLAEESSDEEEGRSGLGRAKKQKTTAATLPTTQSKVQPKTGNDPPQQDSRDSRLSGSKEQVKNIEPLSKASAPEAHLNNILSRVHQASPESTSSMTLTSGSTDESLVKAPNPGAPSNLAGQSPSTGKSPEEIRRQKQLKKQRKRERERLKQKLRKSSTSG